MPRKGLRESHSPPSNWQRNWGRPSNVIKDGHTRLRRHRTCGDWGGDVRWKHMGIAPKVTFRFEGDRRERKESSWRRRRKKTMAQLRQGCNCIDWCCSAGADRPMIWSIYWLQPKQNICVLGHSSIQICNVPLFGTNRPQMEYSHNNKGKYNGDKID